jgi:hypothetical protein
VILTNRSVVAPQAQLQEPMCNVSPSCDPEDRCKPHVSTAIMFAMICTEVDKGLLTMAGLRLCNSFNCLLVKGKRNVCDDNTENSEGLGSAVQRHEERG